MLGNGRCGGVSSHGPDRRSCLRRRSSLSRSAPRSRSANSPPWASTPIPSHGLPYTPAPPPSYAHSDCPSPHKADRSGDNTHAVSESRPACPATSSVSAPGPQDNRHGCRKTPRTARSPEADDTSPDGGPVSPSDTNSLPLRVAVPAVPIRRNRSPAPGADTSRRGRGCGFFYLILRIRRFLPRLGALMGQPLSAQQSTNPLVAAVGQKPPFGAIGVELRHRPLGEWQPQVLRATRRHTDQLTDLIPADRRGAPLRVRCALERREPVLVEMSDPKIHRVGLASDSLGDVRGRTSLRRFLHDSIPFVDTHRHRFVPQLPIQHPTLRRRQLTNSNSLHSHLLSGDHDTICASYSQDNTTTY